jgi:hypothetical protein
MPKIRTEIEEAISNRAAKFGILVAKWTDALPNSVGCFNCYDDNKIVCGLGNKNDEILHEEILNVAYCWARTQVLRKSSKAQKIDFEIVDENLKEIRSQLESLNGIRKQCSNIDSASDKIEATCDTMENEIEQRIKAIWKQFDKGLETDQ